VSQVRSGEVQQTASVVAEKGREYGVKGWGLLRGIAATVATQVENAANEHGYNVDLGGRSNNLLHFCHLSCSTDACAIVPVLACCCW
jgi:hypothetical protein